MGLPSAETASAGRISSAAQRPTAITGAGNTMPRGPETPRRHCNLAAAYMNSAADHVGNALIMPPAFVLQGGRRRILQRSVFGSGRRRHLRRQGNENLNLRARGALGRDLEGGAHIAR